MVQYKIVNSISQLQTLQFMANKTNEAVFFHSMDGHYNVDAKSFIGLFSLDFTKPVEIVCNDEKFFDLIAGIGETLTKEEAEKRA